MAFVAYLLLLSKMINRLFQLTASLVLLSLLIGIVGAAMSGSDRAFDVRPIIAWWTGLGSTTIKAASKASSDRGASPEPINKVVGDALARGKSQVQQNLKKSGASIVQPRSDTGKPDARLAVCKNGSVETQNARDLPLGLALKLRQEVSSGKKFRSLIEVQSRLGQPACNEKTKWCYLVDGNRAIDATETKGSVVFRFTNF